MKTALGSYSIYRQPKKREAGLPQFEWKWVVRFFVGTAKPITRSKHHYPICGRLWKDGVETFAADSCLMCADDPVKARSNCGCQKAVRKWAEKWLEAHTALLQRGELEELEALRQPKRFAPLPDVLAVYRERGPKDRVQRLNFLASIFEQTTGRAVGSMTWDDLTADLLYDWCELRQEAGRRGWLGLGAGKNMPADGWEVLRRLKAENRLPRRDTTTEAPWNTTIITYLASVKSIFGPQARSNELRGLNMPELKDFLGVKLAKVLPCPKGHKEIPAEVLARIEEGLPVLRREDAKAWLFHMLCEETGVRPVSVRTMTGADIEVLDATSAAEWRRRMAKEWAAAEADLCDFGALIRVQATKHGNPVLTPVSAEVAAVACELMTPGSLIGARHVTEAKEVHEKVNAFLRGCGVEGTHAAYLLRHRKGQIMRRFGGRAAVAVSHGHRSEQMADRYSREDRVVPAVGLRKRT